ncbi:MAG: prepilin-type N-terminal cleavage/methylation domain-containing protein [Pseudomonadota bacterium]
MTTTLRHHAAKGFTLIELLIVVIIIAILAAIAIPQFSNTSNDAQEAALDANLATVRSAIELYRVQHNNRYPSVAVSSGGDAACTTAGGVLGTGAVNTNTAFTQQLTNFSNRDGQTCTVAAAGFIYGPYLRQIPVEPITNSTAIAVVIAANAAEPSEAIGGWRFNNATGKFQMNSNAAGRDTNRLLSAH